MSEPLTKYPFDIDLGEGDREAMFYLAADVDAALAEVRRETLRVTWTEAAQYWRNAGVGFERVEAWCLKQAGEAR